MSESDDYLIHWHGISYAKALSQLNRMGKRVKKVTITVDGYQARTSTPTFSVKATLEEETK
jgi:hypothetical protein